MKRFISLLFVLVCVCSCSLADNEYIECWVFCQPDSTVNIREYPRKSSFAFGELECCDSVYTDGKIVNGYLHLVDLAAESTEGWISNNYIVYDKPYKPMFTKRTIITETRVAARRTMNGKIKSWLYGGDTLNVYVISDEWCVTSRGYIKTDFIDTGSYVKEEAYAEYSEMTYEDD